MIPALIVAGALAAGPASTPAGPASHPAVVVVDAGDTLWAITGQYFGDPLAWPRLYAANRREVGPDPGLIYPGQRITLALAPAAAAPGGTPGSGPAPAAGDGDGGPAAAAIGEGVPPAGSAAGGGILGCSGLEALWESAGGPAQSAFLAAEVAMAESGGRQYATGAAGERGYWQIHPDHGPLSTYDPLGNAKAAVIISGYGRDWTAWTTYQTGAYRGLC